MSIQWDNNGLPELRKYDQSAKKYATSTGQAGEAVAKGLVGTEVLDLDGANGDKPDTTCLGGVLKIIVPPSAAEKSMYPDRTVDVMVEGAAPAGTKS